jgi:hypothetical protein
MRVLGSLRAVLGALYTHAGAAVSPSTQPAGGTKRRVSPPHPPVVIPAIAYVDGVVLRARVGAVEADGASQAEPLGVEVFADVGMAAAVGAAVSSPPGVSQTITAGEATAVGAVEAKALPIVVYVPVRVRRDAIDKAWTALQNEEDELLELLGVFE